MVSKEPHYQIAITGMGAVTCNGLGAEALFQSALNEKSGIQDGLGAISNSDHEKILEQFPFLKNESSAVVFSYAAILEAITQAGWATIEPSDGFILATTTGQISLWEPGLLKFLNEEQTAEQFSEAFGKQSLGLTQSRLADLFHFSGPSLVTTSACSAATQAIAMACLWIQSGKVKRCLVGGVELLSVLTTEGFRSLQLLSTEPCTPFDVHRKGINLSEGAGFLCLERAEKKMPHAIAYLTGYGLSTDAYHLASPHPEGEGSVRAMKSALKQANISPAQIPWVAAHGTGSLANDSAEGIAIKTIFGDTPPWVSSTKRIHGHALGASGAVESVLCLKAMQAGVILKTAGLKDPDPAIPVRHPLENLKQSIPHLLKNTLGFGGNNASLIFSREWPAS